MSSAVENPATLRDTFAFFARGTSPRLLMALSAVTVGARVTLGAWSLQDLWIVLGILAAWPFVEWLIHVFVLHFKPFDLFGRRIDPYVAAKHRRHHRDPWRLDILFIPLRSFVVSIPLTFLMWPALFDLPQAFTGIAFVMLMTLHYEWVHLLVHTRYVPKTSFYHRMWKNHRLHHCKNENYWMGVSTQLGDRVLGTYADTKAVPTSPTCRTLGQEDTLGV